MGAQQNHRSPTIRGELGGAGPATMFVGNGGLARLRLRPRSIHRRNHMGDRSRRNNPPSQRQPRSGQHQRISHRREIATLTGQGTILAATIAGPFPTPAPETYTQWKRDLELWAAAQNGPCITQLVAKTIPVLHAPADGSVIEHIGETEVTPSKSTIAPLLNALDERYGETDSEKSWSRMAEFAEFSKMSSGTYKEFRYR